LQLNKHSSCNTTNTSIATPRALQLQLWTCNFNNFYQMNCNSTRTLVATRQALQLQFFIALQLQLNKHTSCNTTISSIATPRALQLQLWTCKFYKFLSDKLQLNEHSSCNTKRLQLQLIEHFSCNSVYVIFIIFIRRIATRQRSSCNSTSTSIATIQSALIATQQALKVQHDKHFNCNLCHGPVATCVTTP
jgi:hypothetical protein